MSDIQRLENELNESKRMLLTLSSKLQSMEAELSELKKVQPVQSVQQVQPQQPVQSAQPQVQPQQPVQPAQPQMMQQPVQPQPQMMQQPVQPQQSIYAQQPQQSVQPKMQWEQKYGPGAQPQPQQQMQPQRPAMQPQQQMRPQQMSQPKKPFSTEAMLGKNIMGIAASVLIFISLILFAMLMIPLLTDTMKVSLMLLVSIGITAFGLGMWFKKEKKSTFFLSLGACGVGSIYISLFMCNAYFHILNDIALYVLILLWAAGVLYLSKYKQRLFEIIGEAGILISVMFGCFSCVKSADGTMLMVLAIYSIIGVAAFLGFRFKDDISLLIHGIAGMISIVAITLANYDIKCDIGMNTEIFIIYSILAIFCIGLAAVYLYRTNNKNNSVLMPLCIILSLILDIIIYQMITDMDISWIAMIILSMIIYILLECMKDAWSERITEGSFDIIMEVWQILELVIIFIAVISVNDLRKYVGISFVAIPLIIYGFLRSDRMSQFKGIGAYLMLVFWLNMKIAPYTIYTLICFALVCIFMYVKRNEYHEVIKCITYGLFMISLTVIYFMLVDVVDLDYDQTIVFLLWILGAINLAALKTPFGKSWVTHDDEKAFKIENYVINGLLMIFGLYLITELSDPAMHFMAVLGTIGLFCINTTNILKKKNAVLSVYLGLKFTILVMVILSSYDASNYVLSICAFIVAIIFIILGFVLDIKSLRIYGLVVSLICVIKLVMVDITYDNTLGHAISFFVSGVLCFVISAVYSVAEKRLKGKQEAA